LRSTLVVLVPRRLPRVLSEYRESSTPFTSLEREVLDLPFLFANRARPLDRSPHKITAYN
jgi:hypothetical protein